MQHIFLKAATGFRLLFFIFLIANFKTNEQRSIIYQRSY